MRAEQRDRIPSLTLLAILLFMQLRIQVAFWAAPSYGKRLIINKHFKMKERQSFREEQMRILF